MLSKYKRQNDNISFFDVCQENPNRAEIILILHGWKQNKESWEKIVLLLSKQYRVICPDLPGFGESIIDQSCLDYSPLDYKERILKLLDFLEIGKVNVLGHSFGGRIAIALAADNPERVNKLILFASGGIIQNSSLYKKMVLTLYKNIKPLAPKTLRDSLSNRFSSVDYNEAGDLKNVFLNAINFNITPMLPKISIPTLVMWGDEDRELPIKQGYIIHKEIKFSKFKVLKGLGHFAFMQEPQLFSSIVLNYLSDNEKEH